MKRVEKPVAVHAEARVAVESRPGRAAASLFALLCLAVSLLWSYWPTIATLLEFWRSNDDYSVGQLVPFVTLYLLWADRKNLRTIPLRTCWWALLVFASAQGIRFVGLYYDYTSLERYSLLLSIAGICMLLLGWRALLRVKWILLFLFLMVPLPGRVHQAFALPLQDFATRSAVVVLELLGFWVVRHGNVIQIGQHTQVAVAEACSGLRMLSAFVFVAATLAFVVRRRPWQKAVVVASSVPIAVASNTVRLVTTVILFHFTNSALAEKYFHDFAGLVMMPMAIVLLLVELWMLHLLTRDAKETRTSTTGRVETTCHKGGATRT